MSKVSVSRKTKYLPTYAVGSPEKNPLFFEKRVYQGSCGKVYPVPFIDKISNEPETLAYDSVELENEFLRLVMLPEIGGRIFIGQDRANRNYDFFYRQDVIKPALVGLAGPWISGGVEFNWPQHHRPGTFLPTDVALEKGSDGSQTVWMSEHDPMNRLKGMHGIVVRPESALIELKARLYNRTALTQTFLWWANVAARVHDNYQSFFPPDVNYVADHAVRAMSSFPLAENDYYGLDYAARPGANDLSRYKNIAVPTSYMVCQTEYDFFGGYDFDAKGGFIHVANKHIAPGKKQWTWGNHEFGWAWDRELTDTNGPYVELMAGVYTDNQPDFSYLAPYEAKTFSQYWWPYQKLGPVQEANTLAAIRCVIQEDRSVELGLAVVRPMEGVKILVRINDKVLLEQIISVAPDKPWQNHSLKFEGDNEEEFSVWVFNEQGEVLIGYRPVDQTKLKRNRDLATEPPLPEAIHSIEELYLTGEHLEQYRHPTRYPEIYWEAGLKRDPSDVRCNIALGRKKLAKGVYSEAASHFEKAIARLTFRHPNPETGEAHYYLGLTRRYQCDLEAAYPLFYKATWNYAWRAAAYYELACIDLLRGNLTQAESHVVESLKTNSDNNKAHVVNAICLRKQGESDKAQTILNELLETDRLDHWALAETAKLQQGAARLAEASRNDAQTVLDVAFDYADCGCWAEAIEVIEAHLQSEVTPVSVPNPLERSPLTLYTLAWLSENMGDHEKAVTLLKLARQQSPDYIFPSRLHEMNVLEWALAQPGEDRNAGFGLGNLYFDKKRHDDAIAAWEKARDADLKFATVHRNLGIAYWNTKRDGDAARTAYEQALECDPKDARLVAEFVQLCGKLDDTAESRLAFLEGRREQVLERDDATVELAMLYNEISQPQQALDLLNSRPFHPWEGGEGKVLRQYTTAQLELGKAALDADQAGEALKHFKLAFKTPDDLGEKYHLLRAKADVLYWQAKALRALGKEAEALSVFEEAANESGDFQSMVVTEFSELTIFKVLSLRELGREPEAEAVLEAMATYVQSEMDVPAKIDYFATSLPNLLVFEEDINETKRLTLQNLLNIVERVKVCNA